MHCLYTPYFQSLLHRLPRIDGDKIWAQSYKRWQLMFCEWNMPVFISVMSLNAHIVGGFSLRDNFTNCLHSRFDWSWFSLIHWIRDIVGQNGLIDIQYESFYKLIPFKISRIGCWPLNFIEFSSAQNKLLNINMLVNDKFMLLFNPHIRHFLVGDRKCILHCVVYLVKFFSTDDNMSHRVIVCLFLPCL